MKWYDVRLWKWAIICLFVGLMLTSFLSCGTQKTVTKQTYLKDKLNEKEVRFTLYGSYGILL